MKTKSNSLAQLFAWSKKVTIWTVMLLPLIKRFLKATKNKEIEINAKRTRKN